MSRLVLFVGWVMVLLGGLGCGSETQALPYDKAVIESLSHLQLVTQIDPAGRVVDLKVERQPVSVEDMRRIGELTELRNLSLYGSELDQAGLQHLEHLGRLEGLGVGKTAITDEALAWIGDVPRLRWLWVFECDSLTEKGLDAFREANPGVEVFVR